MFEGFDARYRRDMESRALQACWIINYTSQTIGKRHIKPKDLVNFDAIDKEIETPEDAKAMVNNLFALHKTKEWMKISDRFAKKQDDN